MVFLCYYDIQTFSDDLSGYTINFFKNLDMENYINLFSNYLTSFQKSYFQNNEFVDEIISFYYFNHNRILFI